MLVAAICKTATKAIFCNQHIITQVQQQTGNKMDGEITDSRAIFNYLYFNPSCCYLYLPPRNKISTAQQQKVDINVVEIWDNKVPKHQFGYPSAWHAMILLVENSDRIASEQLLSIHYCCQSERHSRALRSSSESTIKTLRCACCL